MQKTDDGLVFAVDDDDAVRASLRFALEVEGFTVEDYRSGEDLLSAPVRGDPACLVIDYWLPGIDGMALVSALRARGIRCPAILMTTDPPAETWRQANDAGVKIVEKPLFGHVLAESIRAAVNAHAAPPRR